MVGLAYPEARWLEPEEPAATANLAATAVLEVPAERALEVPVEQSSLSAASYNPRPT